MKLFYLHEPNLNKDDIYDISIWEKESLPLGNGFFGANLFGYSEFERVQISENSLANPYGQFEEKPLYCSGVQSFCDILINFKHCNVIDYYRELNLDNATYKVCYQYNKINYVRESFISHKDNVLVYKISGDKKNSISLSIDITNHFDEKLSNTRKHYPRSYRKLVNKNVIQIDGVLEHYNVEYAGVLKVISNGGTINNENNIINIDSADEIIILFTCKTNYECTKELFLSKDHKLKSNPNLVKETYNFLNEKAKLNYRDLYKNHVEDYQSLYSRVDISFGEEKNDMPTDILLENYKNDKYSSYLEALLFQYGRYLLISSSRSYLPANLQGIWSAYESSPWSDGYWHNINLQMNYWSVGPANLLETFIPYINYSKCYMPLAKLHADEYIKIINPNLYKENDNGWIIGTGGWPYYIEGFTRKSHSGPGTGGFTALLFYEYYLFSMDKQYLKEIAYPYLYDMSVFFSKVLKKFKDKYLVEESASPENINKEDSAWNDYHFTIGCAFDQQMIYETFTKTIEASEILNIKNDALINNIKEMVNHLDPVVIGKSGQIKEYREEEYYADFGEKHHRHISQLVGLYPGTVINDNNKDYIKAAKYTLNARGDKSTGWATMHRLCLWSRSHDNSRSMDIIHSFIKNNILTNLWDCHPPFQIDGNLGYVAGVAELLIQSHNGYIELLPCLPKEWKNGYFKGLKARGNFIIDASFNNGIIKKATIKSNSGSVLKLLDKNYLVTYNNKIINPKDGYYTIKSKINDEIIIISK